MRKSRRRVLFIAAVVLLLIPVSATVGLYVFFNSPEFNERIRNLVVQRASALTGAQVSLERIRWSLKEQRVMLEGLTFRGTENASDPALAHIESITAGVNLRSLLQRRVDLFDLTIVNPEFNLRVDSEGRTNIPGPAPQEGAPTPETQFSLSIDAFKITGGKGVINDRRFSIDLDITDLVSDLRYNSGTQILSSQLAYDGILEHAGQPAIPYKMTSEFDFTRGTVIARKIEMTSGRSSVSLQGRIDNVLNPDIAGKLDYSGRFESAFLKRFLPKDVVAGSSTARGVFEFSSGRFDTNGDLTSERVEFAEWKSGPVKAAYGYNYPARQLNLTRFSTDVLGGAIAGRIMVDSLPGQPRFTVSLDYTNIDTAQMSSAYPWDPKYMVYSRADGSLQGWFEGRIDRYEFETTATLSSYAPSPRPGVIALPARGNLTAALKPGVTEIRNSDISFFETRVRAEGLIAGSEGDLTVTMESEDLANLFFLYPGANGKGSFRGTLTGPLKQPTLEGQAALDGHKYREWVIQHAEGGVKLDMPTEMADLRSVGLTIGDSTATVSGSVRLDGTSLNLAIRSDRIRAEDFQSLTKERVEGILSGSVMVTSLNPLNVTGSVKSSRLSLRGHSFEAVEGNLTYNEPSIEIRNLKASEGEARLAAEIVRFTPPTGALEARADITALPLSQLKELGIPETLGGTVQTAHLSVTGTPDKRQIAGNAIVENLSFRGETFPRALLQLRTEWPILHVTVTETQNVSLAAQLDLATPDKYPFEVSANFTDYSLEKLARFSKGTLVASGNLKFKGQLIGQAPFSGSGVINSIAARIRDVEFLGAEPFEFGFDSKRITLDKEASFKGAYGTRIRLKGYVGLENSPPLDLEITGNLDLSEAMAANEFLSVTGSVALLGRIRGTTASPTVSGTARISGGSLGREGIYTTVSNLNGDLRFAENRITFDNLQGQIGGGEVRIRGTGLIQNSQIENLNVRIDANQVRLRYPAGLSSSVTGVLGLTGTSNAPVLSGDLRLNSLTYRSEFESFLSWFRPGGLNSGGSALDRLRLSVHLEGNQGIEVKNELTDIAAARMNLDIGGTWGNPTLTGHVEITEGALLFQGKRFDITRGNIDFVDRLKIDPVVDIQAETDVRDYRVILIVSGRSDRIHVDPTSDPPLPQVEVIGLITGGKTRDELERSPSGTPIGGGNASLPTSEELFPSAAATIFTDMLRSRVGNRIGLMGLDWIRIDPRFGSAASNPAFRVTVSQQVSKDLSITYSQDLSSTEQRLIVIEYFVSRNLSIVASREETNETSAVGLDIKLRKRF